MPLAPVKMTRKVPHPVAQSAIFRQITVPSPNKGLDLSTPLTDQDPRAAVILKNLLCRRVGVELRKGSLRWSTNLGGIGTESEVVSIMSYNPPGGVSSGFFPKLFAACADGKIYDITNTTDESTVPPVSVTIPGQLSPGRFSWTNFATAATNFLCICAAGGGYWTYDNAAGWVDRTGLITPGTPATPVPAINFDFVMTWKNRLWFIVNNTGNAYYLDTGAIMGAASRFSFGPLFVHGGDLTAMASWTLDAGDGVDDKLVVVSRGGDVLVYQGTDPTIASAFGIVGKWFTARPPLGRRFMSKYGGDLYIITELGIEYMTNLLRGQGLLSQTATASDPAQRFNEVIGAEVRATRAEDYWRLIHVVGEDGVIIETPFHQPSRAKQYFFGILSHGWSEITGWPGSSFESHMGDLFYGTEDGKICKAFTGTTDDELPDGTLGRSPNWELQSSFIAPNDDKITLKRPLLLRAIFQGPAAPEFKARINTEWHTTPVPGSPPVVLSDLALWDAAIWNASFWAADVNAYSSWVGVEGLGVYFSLRMSIRGIPGTFFNSWSVTYEGGGVM